MNTSEAASLREVTCAHFASLCVVRLLVKQTDRQTDVPPLQQYTADEITDLLTYKTKKEDQKSNRNVAPSSGSATFVCRNAPADGARWFCS